mmetsp:Transcript_19466/g.49875  ORF Transcript_19466/g.49875 Transcript_19466/m.49875 type:complete len:107 (+) Transcript_19466:96-416(+)|eukprot:CAMPEP_0113889700 /NCGR_PEP_ID=MMETSP0780_2-20120614/13667_1 /TAXON_ID=652834 /ORGANISM="Palpitomonas bilix" /LENGTH=106 /DNA_ID=CAMNT_0000878877 /DNA_START=94 /DNA_END=414 /DNA_ORIENTATION=+ /assembly_acc=CAM_ASM_000599
MAEGQEHPEYVKLISCDGKEFFCERKAAMISGTIKNMLTGPGQFTEKQMGEVSFPEISGDVLEKVLEYFHYKLRYTNVSSAEEVPEFDITPQVALPLLMAANYLEA